MTFLTNAHYFNRFKGHLSTIKSGGMKSRQLSAQGLPKSQNSNPNNLRIIGGSAKGKKIESPDVYLRPMMAKVREALFNSLTNIDLFNSQDVSVLDIFSGSGSIGLEALSRGAAHATFVDFSRNCIDTSLKNAESLGFSSKVKGVCGKAEEVLKIPSTFSLQHPYQLITLTPPYEEVIYKELIHCLITSPLVQENSIVVIEYPVELGTLPYIIDDSLYGMRNRRYGRTVLATYVFKPTRTFDMRPDEFIQSR